MLLCPFVLHRRLLQGGRLSKCLPALQAVLRAMPSTAGHEWSHAAPGFCLDLSAERGEAENLMEAVFSCPGARKGCSSTEQSQTDK